VLGVQKSATIDEVKAAFRHRAKETHPDLHGGSTESAARFRAVADAYAILSDPVQRQRFDETGSVDQQRVSATRDEIYATIAYIRQMAEEAKASARAYALRGLAWLVAGTLVTAIGFASAASSGGSFPICWGAILFGGIQAVRGLVAYSNISARAAQLEREVWATVTEHTGAAGRRVSAARSAG
jgi:curved DNA-binding protein CbpA